MGLARVVVLLPGLGVDTRRDSERLLRATRRWVFGCAEDLGASRLGQRHRFGSPRAAHLAQHGGAGHPMEAVGVIGGDRSQLVASELGTAFVVRRRLGVTGAACERFKGEERLRSGRTVQVPVPTDRPGERALGAAGHGGAGP